MHLSRLRKTKRALALTLAMAMTGTIFVGNVVVSASTTETKSSSNSETPPALPDGESGKAPANGETPPSGEAPSGGGGGGANTASYDYSGTVTGAKTADGAKITSDGETVSAKDKDENAALVQNAGTLTMTDVTLNKSGDDTDGDNCNFYGINSIFLAVNQDSIGYISGSTLSATSTGSNGIFATDNATVYANNDTITTTADNSRGLDATYGGTIVANKLTISTEGDHCAGLATDRGGGYISVTDSTITTAGSGSPLLYSTGDIEVNNVTGTASGSQIAGMEGLNTILIYKSNLTSTITDKTASDPIADGVIIYQSTSGDAETTTGKTATFEAVDSTLSSAITSGAMFYVTNTQANIVLSGTTLDFDSSHVNLLTIAGNNDNGWGTAGSNGGTVSFTGIGETLSGNISVDTISSLNLFLLKGTTYTGATSVTENSVNTKTTDAPITVNVDNASKWVVTGNSTVTNLNVESGGTIVDADGNTVTIVVDGTTKVKGNSQYSITVTGSYSTTVTTDDSNAISGVHVDRAAFDSYYGVSTSFGTLNEKTTDTAADATDSSTKSTSASVAESSDSNYTYFYLAGGVLALSIIGGAVYTVTKKKK